MFASAYFAPTYFAPTYFPPAGLLEAIRKGGFALGGIKKRRAKLEREIEETQARISLTAQTEEFDLVDFAEIESDIDRELARLLQLQARADLALLDARLETLRHEQQRFLRRLEDAFILLIMGD